MSHRKLATMALGLATVGVATVVPVIGTFAIAPLCALAVGAGVAWSAARGEPEGSLGRGLGAGTLAGIGALVGTVLGFTVLAFLLGADPTLQEMVRSSEPHSEARIPAGLIAPLAAATGALLGLLWGGLNLALATLGGLLGALAVGLSRGARAQTAAQHS
jgi:hypothetical protein